MKEVNTMKFNPLPSYKTLHKLFVESSPGILRWRNAVNYKSRKEPAGFLQPRTSNGVIKYTSWGISIKGRRYLRSRVIFKMHHGVDPFGVIDHINRDSLDDRIENLRDVTHGQNCRNSRGRDGSRYFVDVDLPNGEGFKVVFAITCPNKEERDQMVQDLNLLCSPYLDKSCSEWLRKREQIDTIKKKLTYIDLKDILNDL